MNFKLRKKRRAVKKYCMSPVKYEKYEGHFHASVITMFLQALNRPFQVFLASEHVALRTSIQVFLDVA